MDEELPRRQGDRSDEPAPRQGREEVASCVLARASRACDGAQPERPEPAEVGGARRG
jgi:hypothetical protein